MEIYDLRINTNILGTDNPTPEFSWKTLSDNEGVFQTSYRITVSDELNNILWDTKEVLSDTSVNIPYEGEALKPKTKYFWRVNVRDNFGNESEGCAYFETGLMGKDISVWDDGDTNFAKWIGSPYDTINTGAVYHYRLSVDFRVSYDSSAGIAVNARNFDKYILFKVDPENKKVRVYERSDNAWSGSHTEGVASYLRALGKNDGYDMPSGTIGEGQENEWHNLELEVNGARVTLKVNGSTVIDNESILYIEDPHHPYKRRLFLFGFKQIDCTAEYDNLKLESIEPEKKTLIDDGFDDAGSHLSSLGEIEGGRLIVKNRFDLTIPDTSISVRKQINVKKGLKSARLYSTARGFYDVYINGKKHNLDFFNPGFTDYRKRIMYQTYDITSALSEGENIIGASVGNGYYSGFLGYNGAPMIYGKKNSFLGKIVLTYEDGTEDITVTDESWQFTNSTPIIYNDYLNGEIYDARITFDWTDIKSPKWKSCGVIAPPKKPSPTNGELDTDFILSAQNGPTATIYGELRGIYMGEIPTGHFVYDLGQNMVGTVRIRVKGKKGDSIKIRYGEMCYKNGEVYLRNLRSAFNTDVYILNGDKDGEEFIPSFTSHGFRYVEITGNGDRMESNDIIKSVTGLVLTNTAEVHSGFECSNPDINKLFSNIIWGQRGNSLLVYTDCPQRNERMGWTGDAQVFARTAAYNMNIKAFMGKWLMDLRDAQLMYNKLGAVPDTAPLGGDNRPDGCAGWADASVIVPWELFRAYGDINILKENYGMMKRWVEYQNRPERRNYGLRTVDGFSRPEMSDIAEIPYIQPQQSRGDHLTFDKSTPFILSATAYAARVADIMVKTAGFLGISEDVKKYTELYNNICKAFRSAWVKEDGSIAYWGEMSFDETKNIYYSEKSDNKPSQTAYVLAIEFGLIPKDKMSAAAEFLKAAIERAGGCLTTGFLGVSHLNPTLTKVGLNDTAYSLIEQDKNPSWLYSVKNGATTIWERWNSYIAESDTFGDVSMNSFNHYSYGAIGEWIMMSVLGIEPSLPGYKRILIKPVVGKNMTFAKGHHISPYGIIKSGWEKTGDEVKLSVTIPPNTTAKIIWGGKEYEVKSGDFEFFAPLKTV